MGKNPFRRDPSEPPFVGDTLLFAVTALLASLGGDFPRRISSHPLPSSEWCFGNRAGWF
jgi:hypothetical protein